MRIHQILRRFRWIPLVGPAFECHLSEHWQTSKEIFPGLLWSMLPIWVGTFFYFVYGTAYNWTALQSAFSKNIAGGELFIYAAAFLAPMFWIIHNVPPGAGPFPSPQAHTWLTVFVTVFAACSLEIQKSTQPPNQWILHSLALLFFWASVILIYLATLYDNHRLPIVTEESIRSDQDKFLSKYKARHT